MPPLDWSIVQSILLTLVLPSFGLAALVMAIASVLTRSATHRSTAASLGLIAGLSAGLGLQNMNGDLIPFSALQRVASSHQQDDEQFTTPPAFHWELETGWYALFSMSVVAAFAEILIESVFRQRLRIRLARIATALTAIVCAMMLTPWNLHLSQPWICGSLAVVILLNWTALRLVGQMNYGACVPLAVSSIWCGSAAVVIVFTGFAKIALLTMILSCALAGIGLVTFSIRQRLTTGFAVPAAFMPGLMLADKLNTYSDVPIASFVLVAIAPAALIFLLLTKARVWFGTRPILLAIAFLIPCAIATGLAIRAEAGHPSVSSVFLLQAVPEINQSLAKS